jgi:hypothetical protein
MGEPAIQGDFNPGGLNRSSAAREECVGAVQVSLVRVPVLATLTISATCDDPGSTSARLLIPARRTVGFDVAVQRLAD